MSDSLLAHAVLLAISAIAAFTDARTGHIPNWLTLPVLVIAPLAHAVGSGMSGLWASMFGLFVCAAVPALVFALSREGMGGGDVKLFAALGAVGGAHLGIEIEFLSFVTISAYALVKLAWRGRLFASLANSTRIFVNLFVPAARRRPIAPEVLTPLRLGAAILAASLYCLFLRHGELWA